MGSNCCTQETKTDDDLNQEDLAYRHQRGENKLRGSYQLNQLDHPETYSEWFENAYKLHDERSLSIISHTVDKSTTRMTRELAKRRISFTPKEITLPDPPGPSGLANASLPPSGSARGPRNTRKQAYFQPFVNDRVGVTQMNIPSEVMLGVNNMQEIDFNVLIAENAMLRFQKIDSKIENFLVENNSEESSLLPAGVSSFVLKTDGSKLVAYNKANFEIFQILQIPLLRFNRFKSMETWGSEVILGYDKSLVVIAFDDLKHFFVRKLWNFVQCAESRNEERLHKMVFLGARVRPGTQICMNISDRVGNLGLRFCRKSGVCPAPFNPELNLSVMDEGGGRGGKRKFGQKSGKKSKKSKVVYPHKYAFLRKEIEIADLTSLSFPESVTKLTQIDPESPEFENPNFRRKVDFVAILSNFGLSLTILALDVRFKRVVKRFHLQIENLSDVQNLKSSMISARSAMLNDSFRTIRTPAYDSENLPTEKNRDLSQIDFLIKMEQIFRSDIQKPASQEQNEVLDAQQADIYYKNSMYLCSQFFIKFSCFFPEIDTLVLFGEFYLIKVEGLMVDGAPVVSRVGYFDEKDKKNGSKNLKNSSGLEGVKGGKKARDGLVKGGDKVGSEGGGPGVVNSCKITKISNRRFLLFYEVGRAPMTRIESKEINLDIEEVELGSKSAQNVKKLTEKNSDKMEEKEPEMSQNEHHLRRKTPRRLQNGSEGPEMSKNYRQMKNPENQKNRKKCLKITFAGNTSYQPPSKASSNINPTSRGLSPTKNTQNEIFQFVSQIDSAPQKTLERKLVEYNAATKILKITSEESEDLGNSLKNNFSKQSIFASESGTVRLKQQWFELKDNKLKQIHLNNKKSKKTEISTFEEFGTFVIKRTSFEDFASATWLSPPHSNLRKARTFILRLKIHKRKKVKNKAEYVISKIISNIQASDVTASKLIWMDSSSTLLILVKTYFLAFNKKLELTTKIELNKHIAVDLEPRTTPQAEFDHNPKSGTIFLKGQKNEEYFDSKHMETIREGSEPAQTPIQSSKLSRNSKMSQESKNLQKEETIVQSIKLTFQPDSANLIDQGMYILQDNSLMAKLKGPFKRKFGISTCIDEETGDYCIAYFGGSSRVVGRRGRRQMTTDIFVIQVLDETLSTIKREVHLSSAAGNHSVEILGSYLSSSYFMVKTVDLYGFDRSVYMVDFGEGGAVCVYGCAGEGGAAGVLGRRRFGGGESAVLRGDAVYEGLIVSGEFGLIAYDVGGVLSHLIAKKGVFE